MNKKVTDFDVGKNFSVVIAGNKEKFNLDEKLYVFGLNKHGLLGATQKNIPVPMEINILSRIPVKVLCGNSHMLILTSNYYLLII